MPLEQNTTPDIHEQIDTHQESLQPSADDLNAELSQDMAYIDSLQAMIKDYMIYLDLQKE